MPARPRHGYFEEEELGKSYDIKILKRIYPFVRPYRAFILCSIFLIVLISLIDLSIPYITKIAIDHYIVPEFENEKVTRETKVRYIRIDITDAEKKEIVRSYPDLFEIQDKYAVIAFGNLSLLEKEDTAILRKGDLDGVALAAAAFIGAILISFILHFFQVMITEYTSQKIMYDLRIRLFSHIQGLSVSFFTRNPVGRLVTRVTNDVQNMQEVFSSMIVVIFKDALLISGVTAILLSISWKLALMSFTVLPLILYGSVYFASNARTVFRVLRVKIAEINTLFSETISGIRIIQLFGQEMKNYRDFKQLNHEHYTEGLRQVRIFATFLRFTGFTDIFVVAVVIFYGGRGVLEGSISLGDLVAFLAYMKMFFSPIQDISQKYNIIQNAMASAERIFLILDSEERLPVVNGRRTAGNESQTISEIEMADVSFAYIDDETVLKGISFKVCAGETIAVVGPTGSGKTSLINLMVRFYDPTSGRVLINGQDIKKSDVSELRSKIALVTQDPFLFSGSIRDNIFYEKDGYPEDAAERILAAANCKSFIDRLPDRIDTELSEGGTSVSSGERQLISVARAFARDPELIILDEATSYIDSETEAKIQEALSNLMQNRTSVIVAHRLSTTRNADNIIVLNKGEIIESGTHDALMKRRGFYFRLNQLQG
ncbi:ABC transporter ATP-binding protein [Desulfococcaceae bacterium HSG8]|nr:ABC transporter ATP-binding protein [Desulfococcaceae bacterium HSG8]